MTGTECLLGNRELTVGASWEAGPAESCIHHSFPIFLFNLAGTLPAPEGQVDCLLIGEWPVKADGAGPGKRPNRSKSISNHLPELGNVHASVGLHIMHLCKLPSAGRCKGSNSTAHRNEPMASL